MIYFKLKMDIKISPQTKVYELLQHFPELIYFFFDLGICGCGFPWESEYFWTLEEVAKRKNIELEKLISELEKKILELMD
jgi:hypothetical protein